jgi:hypothetical protein
VGGSGLSDLIRLGDSSLVVRRARGVASLLGAPTALVDAVWSATYSSGVPTADVSIPDAADPLDAILEIGRVRESAIEDHSTLGAVYTPWPVSRELAGLTLPGGAVCDPAMGGGVFLLAAAEAAVQQGVSAVEAGSWLYGADIDPDSVLATRLSVALWFWWRCGIVPDIDALAGRLVVADVLVDRVPTWAGVSAGGGFDVVLGNPPFLGQFKNATRRDVHRAEVLRDRFGSAVATYTDDVMLFVLLGAELSSDVARIAMIMPESMLAVDGSKAARVEIDSGCRLTHLWFGQGDTFDSAAVDVVAPVWCVGGDDGDVALIGRPGADVSAPLPAAGEWAQLLAAHAGIPQPSHAVAGTVGDLAAATADFRDRYYDLAVMVRDQADLPDAPRLITVGLVDPLHFRHGQSPVRFAKQRYEAPVVDLAAAPSAATERWLAERMVPKLLVATQTKVIECTVDPVGDLVPSTPLLVVVPSDPNDVWRLAAVLSAPLLSAMAAATNAGTGLAVGTMRMRASQVATLPLPANTEPWNQAAELVKAAHGRSPEPDLLASIGALMNDAYGVLDAESDRLLTWWRQRLPVR